MISGKDNQIEELDIHHTLEAVVEGVVDSQDVAVQGQEVRDMASKNVGEMAGVVGPRMRDSLKAAETWRV
jgi:hypothetical protein